MAAARGLRPGGGVAGHCRPMGKQHWPPANRKAARAATQWGGSARRTYGAAAGCRALAMSGSRVPDAASDPQPGGCRRTWAELLGRWVRGPWACTGPGRSPVPAGSTRGSRDLCTQAAFNLSGADPRPPRPRTPARGPCPLGASPGRRVPYVVLGKVALGTPVTVACGPCWASAAWGWDRGRRVPDRRPLSEPVPQRAGSGVRSPVLSGHSRSGRPPRSS